MSNLDQLDWEMANTPEPDPETEEMSPEEQALEKAKHGLEAAGMGCGYIDAALAPIPGSALTALPQTKAFDEDSK